MSAGSLAPRHARAGMWAAAVWSVAGRAVAVDCAPPSDTSTCVDADSVWTRPTPGRLATVGAAVPDAGTARVVVRAGYARRPIVITAPSPDPSGRELDVVSDTTSLTVGGAYGVVDRLALGSTLSLAPWRSGTGLGGVTTTSRAPLPSPALRDPKLHAALAVLRGRRRAGADLAVGLDASVPLGAASSFSGAASVVGAPWISVEWRNERLVVGAELGARLQESVRVAGTELGHQLAAAPRGGYRCPEDAYGVTLELRALAPLASSERRSPSGELIEELPVVAEWLAAGWWYVDRSQNARLSLNLGTALPLARRSVGGDDEWVTAPTAPALRAVAGLDLRFGTP